MVTPAVSDITNENVKNPSNRRTSLIPVKSNRTSELRRASIVRSKSVSHDLTPFQCKTPKRPIPSASMAKSVNAMIRSESMYHSDGESLPARQRKSLGANMSLSKSKTNFPKIVDRMNLFTVVTDEMKKVGPMNYVTSKFGSATNSPKRTPKKALFKSKRLSLRSEVSFVSVCRISGVERRSFFCNKIFFLLSVG